MTTPATNSMVEQMQRYFNAVKERLGSNGRLLFDTEFNESQGTEWTWDLNLYLNNASNYDFLTCRIDIFYSSTDGGFSPVTLEPSQVIFKYSITSNGLLKVTKVASVAGVNPPYRMQVYWPSKRYVPVPVNPEVVFDGEITGEQLINMTDLAGLLGVTEGTAFNSDSNWLKFVTDEKTLYVAKKPIRHSLSWDHLNSLGVVDGTREITIGANRYKARLLSGVNDTATSVVSGYDTAPTHGSEWNRLMYHIHSGVFTDPLNKITSEGINTGNLASYSDADLGLGFAPTGGDTEEGWSINYYGPTDLYRHVAAAIGENFYIQGGKIYFGEGRYNSSGDLVLNTPVSTLRCLNTVTGEWYTLKSGPARVEHSAVVIDDKMYVYGGKSTDNSFSDYSQKTLHVYDPTTDIWTQLADGITNIASHTAVAIDGKMYVYGGRKGDDGDGIRNLNMYDPATDTWTAKKIGPKALYNHSAVAIDGKMYVYGGASVRDTNASPNLYCYDPINDTWTTLKSNTVGRIAHTAVAIDGKMYVYGGGSFANFFYQNEGGGTSQSLNTFYCYDPVTNEWAQLDNATLSRRGHKAAVINGKMYVYGGASGSSISSQFFYYQVKNIVVDNVLGTNSYCLNDLSGNVVGRGKYGISYITTTTTNDLSSSNGWRPVLELVASDPRNIIFEGEITGNQLISMSQLTTEAGVTQGSAMNLDTNWLKFLVDNNPIYVAKRPIRNNLSYNALETLGLTDGSKVLTIGQAQYRLRLLKSSIDNTLSLAEPGYDPGYTHGSEWNELMYRIHSGTFTNPLNTMASVGSAASSEARYTDDDLGLGGLENEDWIQSSKLLASDGAAEDYFGGSVSISADGTTALVGAYEDNDKGLESGSAYVFTRNGSSWIQSAKLTASDGAAGDHFGYSVSISADGTTALVGAYLDGDNGRDSGSAYVFTRDGSSWIQSSKLVASDDAAEDYFGYSVSISADGTTALIGAYGDDDKGLESGSAYVFTRNGSSWIQSAKLTASDGAAGDRFGRSVSINADGTTALVGAHYDDDISFNGGSAYIFTRNGSNWIQSAKLTAPDIATGDRFGQSVSISANGTTALIGSLYDDDDDKGTDSGSAYVFIKDGSNWIQSAKLVASDGAAGDLFGQSVSISADGTTALVGAYEHDDNGSNSGSAYIFTRNGSNWIQSSKLVASDGAASDFFGCSVSISADGTTALVGAFRDDDKGADSGSVYVFDGSGSLVLGSGNFTLPNVGADKIVTRGLNGVSYSNSIDKSLIAEQYGWRPVLEFVGKVQTPEEPQWQLTTTATTVSTSKTTEYTTKFPDSHMTLIATKHYRYTPTGDGSMTSRKTTKSTYFNTAKNTTYTIWIE